MQFNLLCENSLIYSAKRLLEEATKRDLICNVISPVNFFLPLTDNSLVRKDRRDLFFHRSTGIYYDDVDLVIAKRFEHLGSLLVNPHDSLMHFRQKDHQLVYFFNHNLPVIPTAIYRGKIEAYFEKVMAELMPYTKNEQFIVKNARGNKGIGVNLFRGKDSLFAFLETMQAFKDQRFIVQPFLESSTEYRVFLAGDDILGGIKKCKTEFDFRKNAGKSQACFVQVNELPQKIKDISYAAFKLSNANYAGVDIIESDLSERLLEINLVPGIEQMESLSKINIASKLISDAIAACIK